MPQNLNAPNHAEFEKTLQGLRGSIQSLKSSILKLPYSYSTIDTPNGIIDIPALNQHLDRLCSTLEQISGSDEESRKILERLNQSRSQISLLTDISLLNQITAKEHDQEAYNGEESPLNKLIITVQNIITDGFELLNMNQDSQEVGRELDSLLIREEKIGQKDVNPVKLHSIHTKLQSLVQQAQKQLQKNPKQTLEEIIPSNHETQFQTAIVQQIPESINDNLENLIKHIRSIRYSEHSKAASSFQEACKSLDPDVVHKPVFIENFVQEKHHKFKKRTTPLSDELERRFRELISGDKTQYSMPFSKMLETSQHIRHYHLLCMYLDVLTIEQTLDEFQSLYSSKDPIKFSDTIRYRLSLLFSESKYFKSLPNEFSQSSVNTINSQLTDLCVIAKKIHHEKKMKQPRNGNRYDRSTIPMKTIEEDTHKHPPLKAIATIAENTQPKEVIDPALILKTLDQITATSEHIMDLKFGNITDFWYRSQRLRLINEGANEIKVSLADLKNVDDTSNIETLHQKVRAMQQKVRQALDPTLSPKKNTHKTTSKSSKPLYSPNLHQMHHDLSELHYKLNKQMNVIKNPKPPTVKHKRSDHKPE